VVLAAFGQLGADLCVWCSRCGVRASVLAWSCSSGQSPNPRRVAARPACGRNSNQMSNTLLGMMDSTSFLTIRGRHLLRSTNYRLLRSRSFGVWRTVTAA
jgi:hypothetical protein